MIRLAILDDSLPQQLEHSAAGPLADVQVTFAGTDLDKLLEHCRRQPPHVVILNVDLLPPGEPDRVAQLKDQTQAELVIALYSFLRRQDLEALSNVSRPLRGPVTLARLRSQMLSVIIRHMLDDKSAADPADPAKKGASPTSASAPSPQDAPPPRFSSSQLARLMEIPSAVDCECPNHLSELVASLNAFEGYAKRCQNKNPEDAKLHADLALFAAHARSVMERALERVIEHEKIVL
jgi:hypothetical protein